MPFYVVVFSDLKATNYFKYVLYQLTSQSTKKYYTINLDA